MDKQNLSPTGDNPRYNNCFTLGAKCWEKGKLLKIPVYIDHYDDTIQRLYGSKSGERCKDYELSYEEARREYYRFWSSENWETSNKDLRISLWLDNAMFGDLHIFVIDFDEFDIESYFFKEAHRLADKVTRSQGGGYHMFYGIDKQKAEPLFDSINLLTSENAASFVCKTRAVTRDGANKVDLFCDTGHFIYEWEEWDNAAGLTDKTQELYQLIKENFDLSRPMSSGKGKRASSKSGKSYAMLEELPEEELLPQMSVEQREVFADLKTKSSDCSSSQWFSIGIDIYHIFGAELGGKVFFSWSKPGHSFQPQGCSLTWSNICDRGPDTELVNERWADIMQGANKGKELDELSSHEMLEVQPQVLFPHENDWSDMLEDNTTAVSLQDEQFQFGDLVVQLQENSDRFLLPDSGNKSVTAYEVIALLSGSAFKSYKKQVKPLNDKLQVLPYSERYRAIFYFRRKYKMPPPLSNGNEIVKFIQFALRHTTNIELSQNWQACLDVSNTEEEAAALLVYYGWAPNLKKELPRTENAFYTVEVENEVRHYEIVNDDITLRFEAIQEEARMNLGVSWAIKSKRLSHKEKYTRLQTILKPRLWWRNGIRMGLTKPALDECNLRIGNYIEALLDYNDVDGIPLEEHIYRMELDKSNPGFVWATPRVFDVSMQDLAFEDYQYNITAASNKENAAKLGKVRSRAAAERNFAAVTGDEWTAAELYAQGIDKDKIKRLIENELIERVCKNHYRRIPS